MSFNPDDPLLQLAVVLIVGIITGELFGSVGAPKVTGWIFAGILLRATSPWHGGATGLSTATTAAFAPYMSFVLGYIAFTIGAALHFASLRNAQRRLGLLLLFEALATPSVVVGLLLLVGPWVAPGQVSLRAALLLGAVAIAGAPGTTVLVVQEARARGILTKTLLAAVALIDMVAVAVFVLVADFLVAGVDDGTTLLAASPDALATVGQEFGIAIGVGVVTAAVALMLTRIMIGPAFLGPTMVAVILGAWGVGVGLGASGILSCTFAGIAVSNLSHGTVRSTEAYLHTIGAVLFAAFYTLAGMNLDLALVRQVAGLVGLYFVARFLGKYVGAYTAMSLAGAPKRIRGFLGLSLIPHGGVAVGLLLAVQNDPRLSDVSEVVTAVGLAAVAINQLVGPNALRFALGRARESGRAAPRLLDFLDESHLTVDLTGASKEAIIRALATRLYSTADAPTIPRDHFIEKVLEREAQASTCLAEGLMIPHAILDNGRALTGVLGISSEGLDLGAPDGKPIHAVLLLATPLSDRKRHLEVLAAFARAITRDVSLREQLYHARNAAHAYEVLHAEATEDLNYSLNEP